MILRDVAAALGLEIITAQGKLGSDVLGGYVSDLLSDVIAGAKEGDLWVTLQLHQNIVAVASLNNLAGIIIVGGRQPDAETIRKAEEQEVPLLLTDMTAYEVAGRMYEQGIRAAG